MDEGYNLASLKSTFKIIVNIIFFPSKNVIDKYIITDKEWEGKNI